MTRIVAAARRFRQEVVSTSALDAFLDPSIILDLCRTLHYRGRACCWTPAIVMVTFLRQMLQTGCSCRGAVAHTRAAQMAACRNVSRSADPSAYSQARGRLPLALFTGLQRRIAQRVQQVAGELLWCGRRVFIVDGTGLSLPDTPALQQRFPQPAKQNPGCGFPMLRLTALFCWASGALIDHETDSLRMHEITLFRRMLKRLPPNAVILGDRGFSSYYELARLRERGADLIGRMHVSRPADFRRGIRLGRHDHLLIWNRPTHRPPSIAPPDWEALPEQLLVRHVRVLVNARGVRSRRIEIVTTLLDPGDYPRSALAELYRDRWLVELNLRSLKITLGADRLRCKSVDMVYKELALAITAYNLIRLLMGQAARRAKRDPRRLSFAGTQHRLLAYLPLLALPSRARTTMLTDLLEIIAANRLPHRPHRIEPRCLKRRPKSYPKLWRPRAETRAALLIRLA